MRRNWMSSKKARRPPLRWRRNMVMAVVFLGVLDYIVVSPSPDPTRIAFALIITLAVLGFVAETWRRNLALEKEKVEKEKGAR
jgi:hypothetical protein